VLLSPHSESSSDASESWESYNQSERNNLLGQVLSAKGYGIYYPVTSVNKTTEGRSSSMLEIRLHEERRVEFRIAQR
jgi:hypothetical protein